MAEKNIDAQKHMGDSHNVRLVQEHMRIHGLWRHTMLTMQGSYVRRFMQSMHKTVVVLSVFVWFVDEKWEL